MLYGYLIFRKIKILPGEKMKVIMLSSSFTKPNKIFALTWDDEEWWKQSPNLKSQIEPIKIWWSI